MIEVLPCGQQLLFAAHLHVTHQIGLRAALVVGIAGLDAVARRPFVECGPAIYVVGVALLWVDVVECHEALIVDGTRP